MYKYVRIIFFAILCGILMFSCKKKSSKKEVEENLITAMGKYLNHQPRIDTSMVKFNVLEVAYYEATAGYICDFKVKMTDKTKGQVKDTIGSMSANISKDFMAVKRRE
jgi:hypothetical protein